MHGTNPEPLMSSLGQKRTLRLVSPMSALPPNADIARRQLDVRFVPISDILHRGKIASLFQRQSTVKSVTDLPIGAWYISVIAPGMIPSGSEDLRCNLTGYQAAFRSLPGR